MRRCVSVFVLLASVMAVGCGETATSESATDTTSTDATASESAAPVLADVLKQVKAGEATLLDVRTDGEWDGAHFAKAVHMPLADIDADKAAALAKDKPVYVHCAAGKRAVTGADELKKLGFNAIALETSYDSIKEAGFEEAAK
ncbi:MAG: rhodanese-like domain-containing protein [Planctomycetaceae bacterium]